MILFKAYHTRVYTRTPKMNVGDDSEVVFEEDLWEVVGDEGEERRPDNGIE